MRRASVRAAALSTVLAAATLLGLGAAGAQSPKQVKVVLEYLQTGRESRQGVEGRGTVIVQEKRGDTRVRGRGAVGVEDTTTRTTRTSGVFTIVQDGGTGVMLVAQDVPHPQVGYYYDYALGKGYAVQGVAWQRVGTALTVRPTILPGGQIRVQLTPRISYFTPGGGGSIDLVEAATEIIVPNGQKVQFGGSTGSLHSVTRHILGYRQEQSAGETALALTATIQ